MVRSSTTRAALVVAAALAHGVFAGSSPLSTKGLGLPVAPADARERAMGGSGLASTPAYGPSLRNPSRTAFNSLTSFTVMMESELNWLQDDITSNRILTTLVPLVAMNFQAGRYGHLGLHYFQRYERGFSFSPLGSSPSERVTRLFEGGTSEFGFNWSKAFHPSFSLGLGANYLLGRDRDIERVEFADDFAESNLVDYEDTLLVRRSALYPTVSATYRTKPVQLGLSLSLPADVDERLQPSIRNLPREGGFQRNVDLPLRAAAGASLRLGGGRFLNLDVTGEQWEGVDLNDAYGVGLGFERVGRGREFDSYLSRMSYRTGAAWQRLPIDEAQQYSASLGAGLPLGRRGSQMDVALEYVHRGSIEDLGFAEDIVRLSLSLSGVGNWGQSSRPRR